MELIDDPREDARGHYYDRTHQVLQIPGAKLHHLTNAAMRGMFRIVERYRDNIQKDVIFRGVRW